MTTQRFLGRHSLLKRLTAQVGNEETAKQILIKRGHMNANGSLTPAGMKRDNMTAAERAKDRAAKSTGASPTTFTYDPKTNRARKK